jgi:hypothetical protein
MSTIGGPGGIGGPKGPKGPDGPAGPDGPDDVSGPDVAGTGAASGVSGAGPVGASDIDQIAADLAAGRLTPHEAIDKLVDQIAGTDDLAPADRAELRELMADLVANDPHLAALVGRL